ncbi:MAG: hypothetical protein NVSMB64_00580 [Candidatus Velthaea sp.]
MFLLAAAVLAAVIHPPVPRLSFDTVPFSQIGYDADARVEGPRPRVAFDVPSNPRLAAVAMHLILRVSPAVDGRSTLDVVANGKRLLRTSVAGLRKRPQVDVALPVGVAGGVTHVALEGELFAGRDVCADVARGRLWLSVSRASALRMSVRDVNRRPFIAQFLDPFAARIRVVVPKTAPAAEIATVVPFAYQLHQIERWRNRDVVLASSVDPSDQNIVIDAHTRRPAAPHELALTPDGMRDARRDVDQLFAGVPEVSHRRIETLSLRDLGMAERTVRGVGPLPMFGGFNDAAIGAAPLNPRLHLDVVHARFAERDRAVVKTYFNERLVDVQPLHARVENEEIDVSLPQGDLRALNSLAIVPTYVPRDRESCTAGNASFALTLRDESRLEWTRTGHVPIGVGDFFTSASGRLAVMTADPTLLPAAFQVLDALGETNASVRTIDVRSSDWHVPAGFDYAIVILPPDLLARSAVRFKHEDLPRILAPLAGSEVVRRIGRARSYLSLQTAVVRGTPTLFVSFEGDSSAAGSLARTTSATLKTQRGDLLLLADEGVLYSTPDAPEAWEPSYADHIRKAALPALGVFSVAVAFFVTVASRQREPHA